MDFYTPIILIGFINYQRNLYYHYSNLNNKFQCISEFGSDIRFCVTHFRVKSIHKIVVSFELDDIKFRANTLLVCWVKERRQNLQ